MFKLFLDDTREPDKGTILARSVDEAVDLINKNGFPNFISFDNDLGSHLEGIDFVNIIIQNTLDKKWIIPQDFSFEVHSDNIPANENIKFKMNNLLLFLNIKFKLEKSTPYSQRK